MWHSGNLPYNFEIASGSPHRAHLADVVQSSTPKERIGVSPRPGTMHEAGLLFGTHMDTRILRPRKWVHQLLNLEMFTRLHVFKH